MIQLTNNLPPVTEWFDGKTTVPGQPGFYQRRYDSEKLISVPDFWDGEQWQLVGLTGDDLGPAEEPNMDWRGLTEEVKS